MLLNCFCFLMRALATEYAPPRRDSRQCVTFPVVCNLIPACRAVLRAGPASGSVGQKVVRLFFSGRKI